MPCMDVSENRGILPPKWMVKIMETRKTPIKMDDLGGFTPIFRDMPYYLGGLAPKRLNLAKWNNISPT